MRGDHAALLLCLATALASCELAREGFAAASRDAADGDRELVDAGRRPDVEVPPDDLGPPPAPPPEAGPRDAAPPPPPPPPSDAAPPPRDVGPADAGPRDAGLRDDDASLREDASVRPCPPPAPPGDLTPLAHYTFNLGLVGGLVPDESPSGCFPLAPVGAVTVSATANLDGGHLELSPERSAALSALLQAAPGFSVEVWISTDDPDQSGPARIVTLSQSTTERAFTFGHDKLMGTGDGDDLLLRLRTSATSPNGELSGAPVMELRGFFAAASVRHQVVLVWTPPLSLLFVDGAEVDRHDHGGGATLGWSGLDRLLLGDELGGGRVWRGRIHQLTIFAVPLGSAEVDARFRAGTE